mmetsp:Transcript_4252/g.8891  ORF Transcript_4252/g.8891 Transcript_4252/m.8891 type:complete len:252 (-) Transcript_4252:1337-2092(-)
MAMRGRSSLLLCEESSSSSFLCLLSIHFVLLACIFAKIPVKEPALSKLNPLRFISIVLACLYSSSVLKLNPLLVTFITLQNSSRECAASAASTYSLAEFDLLLYQMTPLYLPLAMMKETPVYFVSSPLPLNLEPTATDSSPLSWSDARDSSADSPSFSSLLLCLLCPCSFLFSCICADISDNVPTSFKLNPLASISLALAILYSSTVLKLGPPLAGKPPSSLEHSSRACAASAFSVYTPADFCPQTPLFFS